MKVPRTEKLANICVPNDMGQRQNCKTLESFLSRDLMNNEGLPGILASERLIYIVYTILPYYHCKVSLNFSFKLLTFTLFHLSQWIIYSTILYSHDRAGGLYGGIFCPRSLNHAI